MRPKWNFFVVLISISCYCCVVSMRCGRPPRHPHLAQSAAALNTFIIFTFSPNAFVKMEMGVSFHQTTLE
jgi:hypothetical protein